MGANPDLPPLQSKAPRKWGFFCCISNQGALALPLGFVFFFGTARRLLCEGCMLICQSHQRGPQSPGLASRVPAKLKRPDASFRATRRDLPRRPRAGASRPIPKLSRFWLGELPPAMAFCTTRPGQHGPHVFLDSARAYGRPSDPTASPSSAAFPVRSCHRLPWRDVGIPERFFGSVLMSAACCEP